jgi:hypothetical protein
VIIETEYRGYRIIYSENQDEWTCHDAGDGIRHAKLTGIKAKIDAMLLAERKRGATACLEISGYGMECIMLVDATVIEYLGPIQERDGYASRWKPITDHKVAVMSRRRGSEKASRREERLSGLAQDTAEARDAWAEAMRLHKIYMDARKAYEAAVKAIPRLTLGDVMPLVFISGIDPAGKP